MEKLVKEKEEVVKRTQIPMDVVPLSAVSITRVSTLGTVSTAGTLVGVEKLVEAIQNLSISTVEMKNLQDELKELKHMKVVADNSHATELQRTKSKIEVLHKEIKESYLRNKLGLAKEILWEEITESVKYIWPYIKIIFDKKYLLEKAQETVKIISKELEDMPEIAFEIIKFLISKDNYELEELGINGRTTTILEVKKIIT